jgi:hypothetical protein
VSSIEGRLRRLEEHRLVPCLECGPTPGGHGRIAVINEQLPGESFAGNPDEHCARCGRFLYTVLRIVYGDEGGRGKL